MNCVHFTQRAKARCEVSAKREKESKMRRQDRAGRLCDSERRNGKSIEKNNWKEMKRNEKADSNSIKINVSGPNWTIHPNFCRRRKKITNWQTFARQFNSFWIKSNRSNATHSRNKHTRFELTETNWHSFTIIFNSTIFIQRQKTHIYNTNFVSHFEATWKRKSTLETLQIINKLKEIINNYFL